MLKPYLNYDEQIEKLKSKNLVISNEEYARYILKKYGYYSLICGYKRLFKNPTTKDYIDGTQFEEIVELYEFDTRLREVFLKYLLLTEKHIKEALSNAFCQFYSEKQSAYLDTNNYNYTGKNKDNVNKLINRKLNELLKSTKYPYINHARDNHNNVPLWVIFNALSFGSVSVMYSVLKPNVKVAIAQEYPNLNEGNLGSMLQIASTCRNVCAHGERLFTFSSNKQSISIMALHKKLNIPLNPAGNECVYGQKDLFAVVISLRYLLSDSDFRAFKKDLSRVIDKYEKQISKPFSHISKAQIMTEMGFPSNWKNITKYRKLC